MKKVKLAIIGLGNVPLALQRYINEPDQQARLQEAGIQIVPVGVTTGSRGNAINERGFTVAQLEAVGKTGDVSALNKGPLTANNLEFIEKVPADILLVATPAKLDSLPEIKAGFERGMSVITSNKTPVANHYRELLDEAKRQGVQFGYGATVLAGFPPWNLMLSHINPNSVREIQMVVNATANSTLTLEFEKGMTLEEGIAEQQKLGIAERDPSDDIDGHDTQKKLVILANYLWDAGLTPDDVPTQGIRNITLEDIQKADREGKWIHLMGHASRDEQGRVHAEVKPEATAHWYFRNMRGINMCIWFTLPNAANFPLGVELAQGGRAIMATAAGVFEDLLTIAKSLNKKS